MQIDNLKLLINLNNIRSEIRNIDNEIFFKVAHDTTNRVQKETAFEAEKTTESCSV